ncbi:MAG: ribonuclease P protein component 1 [Candidatus Bathyarchaeia archaeon]
MNTIGPRNVLRHELIGLEARVVESDEPGHIGIQGRIVDETRNTLTINQGGGDKIIAKENTIFHFRLPNGAVVEVEGRYLVGRPEDRVKRRRRKLW